MQESLDGDLEDVRARFGLPALAAAVTRAGMVIAAGTVGTRVMGMELPVTIDDCFDLGSDTKGMTATVAGGLVDAPLTPRTDRRGRVDIVVYRADTLPVWSPQWHLMEAAWLPNGGIIAGEARQEIERAVNVYLRGESMLALCLSRGTLLSQ